ncbi:MAG: 2Fe-2S iron-sulfur cluster-binding protein [Butyricicoccus sp.]
MLRFTLNGTQIEIEDGENRTLLEYLRNVKCMKGTKEACSTGHCGACSVLVDGRLTRSCVTLCTDWTAKPLRPLKTHRTTPCG